MMATWGILVSMCTCNARTFLSARQRGNSVDLSHSPLELHGCLGYKNPRLVLGGGGGGLLGSIHIKRTFLGDWFAD
ncbi:hypothetical protein T484DRAFT_1925170 [Baffinella frigidus]|nr:hypothetical protein T484DRAFT_1925170 [Cryptophyta sp. CCMP2293]